MGIVKHADAGAALQLLGRPFIPAEAAVAATAASLVAQQLV